MHIERVPTQTHETVLHCTDSNSGLNAYIAVHDTTLGPAIGGCRMWDYATEQDALADVLRLSEGMTSKCALAGVPFGGGKAVILGDAQIKKTPRMMRTYGRFVDSLNGAYISGEDVGMSPSDMMQAAQETNHIVGLPEGPHASGDPSPVTADLLVRCMKVAASEVLGSNDLNGRTIAVQGLGHVGMAVAKLAHCAGASIVAADPNPQTMQRAQREVNATIVHPADIHRVKNVDILAPCALGGVLDPVSVHEIHAKIICGSANNQLANSGCAEELHARGITYCPDYVVNSGGLISVAREALRIRDHTWTFRKLEEAERTFAALLAEARQDDVLPLYAADRIVARILEGARRKTGVAGALSRQDVGH